MTSHYTGHLQKIMKFVHGTSPTCARGGSTTGRQVNFRYNNMDQSIEMGRLMAQSMREGGGHLHEQVATGDEIFETSADHEVVDEFGQVNGDTKKAKGS
jgi:hypothetical protein